MRAGFHSLYGVCQWPKPGWPNSRRWKPISPRSRKRWHKRGPRPIHGGGCARSSSVSFPGLRVRRNRGHPLLITSRSASREDGRPTRRRYGTSCGPSLRHFGKKYGPSSRRIAPGTHAWARGCIPRIRNRRPSAMNRPGRGVAVAVSVAQRYVYFWVDGIHVQARLEDAAQCLLVVIGATPEGKKELVGLIDGVRESTQSWRELLLVLKRRGLTMAPELAVADGALGFWQAVEEVWPKTRGQRCWVHKTANVLNKLPKSQHSKAKRALQEIWMAETKKDALTAFDAFVETWGIKYDKAVECLIKDRAALLAFYDFPAEHWKHLRTTNVIESSFATVRHRTVRSKGCLSNKTALAMIFKLAEAAEKSWRRLNGHNQLPKIILGIKFTDGIEVVRSQAQNAAA